MDPLNAGDRGLRECAEGSLELARPRVYCGSARAVLELSVVFGLVVMAFLTPTSQQRINYTRTTSSW